VTVFYIINEIKEGFKAERFFFVLKTDEQETHYWELKITDGLSPECEAMDL